MSPVRVSSKVLTTRRSQRLSSALAQSDRPAVPAESQDSSLNVSLDIDPTESDSQLDVATSSSSEDESSAAGADFEERRKRNLAKKNKEQQELYDKIVAREKAEKNQQQQKKAGKDESAVLQDTSENSDDDDSEDDFAEKRRRNLAKKNKEQQELYDKIKAREKAEKNQEQKNVGKGDSNALVDTSENSDDEDDTEDDFAEKRRRNLEKKNKEQQELYDKIKAREKAEKNQQQQKKAGNGDSAVLQETSENSDDSDDEDDDFAEKRRRNLEKKNKEQQELYDKIKAREKAEKNQQQQKKARKGESNALQDTSETSDDEDNSEDNFAEKRRRNLEKKSKERQEVYDKIKAREKAEKNQQQNKARKGESNALQDTSENSDDEDDSEDVFAEKRRRNLEKKNKEQQEVYDKVKASEKTEKNPQGKKGGEGESNALQDTPENSDDNDDDGIYQTGKNKNQQKANDKTVTRGNAEKSKQQKKFGNDESNVQATSGNHDGDEKDENADIPSKVDAIRKSRLKERNVEAETDLEQCEKEKDNNSVIFTSTPYNAKKNNQGHLNLSPVPIQRDTLMRKLILTSKIPQTRAPLGAPQQAKRKGKAIPFATLKKMKPSIQKPSPPLSEDDDEMELGALPVTTQTRNAENEMVVLDVPPVVVEGQNAGGTDNAVPSTSRQASPQLPPLAGPSGFNHSLPKQSNASDGIRQDREITPPQPAKRATKVVPTALSKTMKTRGQKPSASVFEKEDHEVELEAPPVVIETQNAESTIDAVPSTSRQAPLQLQVEPLPGPTGSKKSLSQKSNASEKTRKSREIPPPSQPVTRTGKTVPSSPSKSMKTRGQKPSTTVFEEEADEVELEVPPGVIEIPSADPTVDAIPSSSSKPSLQVEPLPGPSGSKKSLSQKSNASAGTRMSPEVSPPQPVKRKGKKVQSAPSKSMKTRGQKPSTRVSEEQDVDEGELEVVPVVVEGQNADGTDNAVPSTSRQGSSQLPPVDSVSQHLKASDGTGQTLEVPPPQPVKRKGKKLPPAPAKKMKSRGRKPSTPAFEEEDVDEVELEVVPVVAEAQNAGGTDNAAPSTSRQVSSQLPPVDSVSQHLKASDGTGQTLEVPPPQPVKRKGKKVPPVPSKKIKSHSQKPSTPVSEEEDVDEMVELEVPPVVVETGSTDNAVPSTSRQASSQLPAGPSGSKDSLSQQSNASDRSRTNRRRSIFEIARTVGVESEVKSKRKKTVVQQREKVQERYVGNDVFGNYHLLSELDFRQILNKGKPNHGLQEEEVKQLCLRVNHWLEDFFVYHCNNSQFPYGFIPFLELKDALVDQCLLEEGATGEDLLIEMKKHLSKKDFIRSEGILLPSRHSKSGDTDCM